MTAIALALLSSLSWGLGDFLGGFSARRLPLLVVLAVSQAAGLVVIALVVAVRWEPPPEAAGVVLALGSSFAGILGLAALYRGLAVGLMSVVAPIATVGAVIPVVVGAVTGDAPSGLQYAGIALALAGIALVSRTGDARAPGARLARGAGLGLLAAVGFGLFFLTFDAAAERDPYWAALLLRVGSTTIVGTAVLLMRPSARLTLPTLGLLACVGVFDLGGNAFLAVAFTQGAIGVVAVLSSLYPVVTIALARLVLGERIGRAQAIGAATALAGVAVISVG